MRHKEAFSLIVKPVGSRCNLHCRYCYYLDKGQYSAHAQQTVMEDALLEKLISGAIAANPGPVVSFTWHGGEPTLAGLDFYRKVVALQRKYLPAGWQAWNNLQTNGILLNAAWCRFLAEYGFDVGLSIDGCEAVHDANRLDVGGNPTYQKVKRAAARLMASGIRPDLLCTVTAQAAEDPLGVYHALADMGTGWIQFIPVVVYREDGTLTEESITPRAYGEFLITVFDEWVRRDLGKLDVQLFAECARIFAGGQASVCTMAETCGRVLVAEEDGAIYACDHFVDPEHRLGNLWNGDLERMVNGAFQRQFGQSKKENLTAECRSCPHLKVCAGGCPKDRSAVSPKGEAGQYLLCEGLKAFFDHAKPILLQMMEFSRKGMKPEEIRKKFS